MEEVVEAVGAERGAQIRAALAGAQVRSWGLRLGSERVKRAAGLRVLQRHVDPVEQLSRLVHSSTRVYGRHHFLKGFFLFCLWKTAPAPLFGENSTVRPAGFSGSPNSGQSFPPFWRGCCVDQGGVSVCSLSGETLQDSGSRKAAAAAAGERSETCSAESSLNASQDPGGALGAGLWVASQRIGGPTWVCVFLGTFMAAVSSPEEVYSIESLICVAIMSSITDFTPELFWSFFGGRSKFCLSCAKLQWTVYSHNIQKSIIQTPWRHHWKTCPCLAMNIFIQDPPSKHK